MTEPSDEDITRALARLAKRTRCRCGFWNAEVVHHPTGLDMATPGPQCGFEFSPLTDWRDLGPLIEKYYVSINPRFDMMPMEWEAAKGEYFGYDRSLMRAACLALSALAEEEQQQ